MILQVLGIVLIGAAGALLLIGFFPICRVSLDRRADAVGIFWLLGAAGIAAVFRGEISDSALVSTPVFTGPMALFVRWAAKGRLQGITESNMQCIDKEYESKGKIPWLLLIQVQRYTDLDFARVVLVNETDQALQSYLRTDAKGPLPGPLVPARSTGETRVWTHGDTLRVVARREDRRAVFDKTYTWPELEEMKGRVVIASLDPIAEPEYPRWNYTFAQLMRTRDKGRTK